MKILCIGHAAYDITIPVEGYPQENVKHRVNKKVECGGGPACNSAYLLKLWGLDTYFAGIVGNDVYGNKIKEELESIGVNTKYLEVKNDYNTTTAFIIANQKNGSRTTFGYRPDKVEMEDIDIDFIPDLILVDGHEYELSKKMFRKFPYAIKVVDAGRNNKEVLDLCKMADYVACSKDFAESVSNIKINYTYTNTIVEAINDLKDKFNNNIIITLEEKGCVYEKNGSTKIMPSIKVTPIDSTGAGDIFHGGLCYGLAKKYDYETCLKIANIAGALSVEEIGGRYSIPTLKKVEQRFGKHI